MKSSSLQLLESAQLLPIQARGILEVMEQEIAVHHDDYVRRGELHALEIKITEQLGVLRTELRTETANLRTELKAQGTRYLLWMFSMFTAFSGLMVAVLRR
jgi:hypothetical protein